MTKIAVALFALVSIAGCGGGGGGVLGLTGGSIPTGTITGKIALPSGQTLTSASITATSLDTGQSVVVASNVSSIGFFTIRDVPLSTNLSFTFVKGPATLKTVVPSSVVTASSHSADIGVVDASTTVTAEAIESEITAGVDDASTVISTQFDICSSNQRGFGDSPGKQNDDIHNPISRHDSANHLIISTADSEMGQLADHPTQDNATGALVGVLSYATASGGTVGPLTLVQRQGLITAQTGGAAFTAAKISAALVSAGGTASPAAVTQADGAQRTAIPSFTKFGGISPLEAVAIATCPTSAGGFGLSGAQLSTFVTALLAP